VLDLDKTRDDGFDLTDFTRAARTESERRQMRRRLLDAAERAPVPPDATAEAGEVEFVTFEAFAAMPDDEQTNPLVVDDDGRTVIAAEGIGLVYGTGGAGKTTLFLDGAVHFAAGVAWLGVRPARTLRVGWIENEGPRDEFKRKIARKLALRRNRVEPDRLNVMREPWSRYDFRRESHRDALASSIRAAGVDLLVVGPLFRLGMEGGGTPDEVRAFVALIEDVQARVGRPVFVLIVHHENRAGQVSGAWEAFPDLLVHVVGLGHGKLRMKWQKARWSSLLHGTSQALVWAEDEGFALADEEPPRPERVYQGIADYVLAHGGCAWNEVDAAVPGNRKYLIRRRDAMLADGVLINAGTDKAFKLWHRDDPARPTLDLAGSEDGTAAEPADSDPGGEGENRTGSPVPVRSREPEPEPVPSPPAEPTPNDRASRLPSSNDAADARRKEVIE